VQVLVSPHVDSLTLASSQPRSMVGQGVTFTVTVSGNAPTGQVQFRDGNGNLGSPVALVNGVASFTTSALSVGSHNISAVYAGDANNATNVLPVLVQTVLKAATIAAGHSHALEIRNGKLYAWGYNNDGALGDGTTMTRSFPAVVSLPTNVTPLAVAAGTSHSLAIGSDGKLYAWGSNRYGQVGDNSTTTRLNPVAISLGAGVTPIGVAAGGNQSAAIGSDGYLYMWGVGEILTAAGYVDPTALHLNNYSPQTWTSTPTPVPGLAISTIVVACGDWHNLAVSSIVPGIQAWGNNESGQLGFGFVSPSSSAGFVSPPSAAKVIAAGGNRGQLDGSYRPASPGVRSHSLAIGSDDLIYAWGSNDYGQLGDGTQVARPSPVAIQLTAQTLPVALAAGGLHSLAIGANGALFAWGYNGNGQVGDGTLVQRLAPVQVNLPQGITAVATAAGRSFSMALGSDGRLYTWGWNPQGQLGDGTNIDRSTPAALTNYLPVPQTGLTGSVSPSMAAQAVSFTVVVTGIAPTGTVQFKDGSANLGTPVPLVNGAASLTTATLGLGQHNITAVYSGDAANGPSTSNVVVQTVQPYRVLAGGYAHSLQILAGKLYAWGRNTDGELGDGTNTYRTSRALTQLPAVAAPVVVAAGDLHSMAIGSDGKLYAWGDNTAGTLGDGTTISRNLPAPVTLPGGAAPTAIAAGPYFSVAAGSDNKVYAWGGNFSGQLGDGSRANHALPAQVIMPANVGAVALAAGNGHVLAIGSNGLLYAWGYNAYGQLGDGTTTDRWTPVVVTLAPGVQPVAVAAGSAHSLAIGSDGNFYTWGWNLKGQLGDGTFNSRSAPGLVALPSGVTATFGAAGGNGHSLVIASDGNIYGWGDVFTRGWGHSGSVANSVVTTLPSGAAPIAIAAGENHSLVLGADGKLYAWGNNGFGQLGNKTLTDHVDPIEVSPYVPPAQVVVASSANPALVGQVVTIAVTVSGASPTGTVQFKDGNANLGSALILANGTASLTTSSLGVGSHVITAVYAGDANNAGNLSALFTQVVALSASTTSLYMSPNNAAAGQLQSFTAPVAGASPTGTVQFKDGGVLLGSAAIFNGQAVFATSTLSVGSHSITAFYSGDADNQASTSAALVFSAAAAGGSQGHGGGEDADTPTLPEWGALLLAMLLLWVGAAPKGPCRPTSNCHVAAVPSPGRKY
jgi:alpha-tubulin suppressor-like RCC1 family protein